MRTKKLNVAIFGAGKSKHGLGPYLFREVESHPSAVVGSILQPTSESLDRAYSLISKVTNRSFDNIRGYTDIEELLIKESPDAVIIASPSSNHYDQLEKVIDIGINAMCDKPIVHDPIFISKLKKKINGQVFTHNTQLSSLAYPYIMGFLNSQVPTSYHFNIKTNNGLDGIDMYHDLISHGLSILLTLFPKGKVLGKPQTKIEKTSVDVSFDYSYGTGAYIVLPDNISEKPYLSVNISFEQSNEKSMSFGFNDIFVKREQVYSEGNQKQELVLISDENKRLEIADPLKVSVHRFLDACLYKTKSSFVSRTQALKNIMMQYQLLN